VLPTKAVAASAAAAMAAATTAKGPNGTVVEGEGDGNSPCFYDAGDPNGSWDKNDSGVAWGLLPLAKASPPSTSVLRGGTVPLTAQAASTTKSKRPATTATSTEQQQPKAVEGQLGSIKFIESTEDIGHLETYVEILSARRELSVPLKCALERLERVRIEKRDSIVDVGDEKKEKEDTTKQPLTTAAGQLSNSAEKKRKKKGKGKTKIHARVSEQSNQQHPVTVGSEGGNWISKSSNVDVGGNVAENGSRPVTPAFSCASTSTNMSDDSFAMPESQTTSPCPDLPSVTADKRLAGAVPVENSSKRPATGENDAAAAAATEKTSKACAIA